MRRLALASLVLVGLLPLASAAPSLRVETVGAVPWVGEGEAQRIVAFAYDCAVAPARVAFSVAEAPSWAQLRIEPESVAPPACEGEGTVEVTLFAAAARDADGPGVGRARAAWTAAAGEGEATAAFGIEPPWTASFALELDKTEATHRPQEIASFALTIVNEGWAATRFATQVVSKEGELMAVEPLPITLEPDARALIPLTIQTPYRNGAMDETGVVTYRVTPIAAHDASLVGEPQEITVKVHTKGTYVPLPALVPLAAIAIVALRRR